MTSAPASAIGTSTPGSVDASSDASSDADSTTDGDTRLDSARATTSARKPLLTRAAMSTPATSHALSDDVRRAIASTGHVAPTVVPLRRGNSVTRAAAGLQADAFTTEGVVHLPGERAMDSEQSLRLLAHEATHVAQQKARGGELPAEHTAEGQRLEREALRAEAALTTKTPASVPAGSTAPAAVGEPINGSSAPAPAPGTRRGAAAAGLAAGAIAGMAANSAAPSSLAGAAAATAAPVSVNGSTAPAAAPLIARSGSVPVAPISTVQGSSPTPLIARTPGAGTDTTGTTSEMRGSTASVGQSSSLNGTSNALAPMTQVRTSTPSAVAAASTPSSWVAPTSPSAPPASMPNVQRRASSTTPGGAAGAPPAQAAEVTPPSIKPKAGLPAQPDTWKDMQWLERHADALYPLLRNRIRNELLRDRERRGRMLRDL